MVLLVMVVAGEKNDNKSPSRWTPLETSMKMRPSLRQKRRCEDEAKTGYLNNDRDLIVHLIFTLIVIVRSIQKEKSK